MSVAPWAHKNMPTKNTLIAADADLVESAFKDKLASIRSMQASIGEPAGSVAGDGSATASEQIFVELMEASVAAPISCPRNEKLAAVTSQRKLSAGAIRSTASSSPPSLASCAAADGKKTVVTDTARMDWMCREIGSRASIRT